MRKQFIETIDRFRPAQKMTRTMVQKLAPWAAKIIKVDGGYMAFESLDDYKTWKNQK